MVEPTEWCAPMVPIVKKNASVRICVDLKRLNQAVKRERFILPTLEDIAPKLSGASVFSTLDASSGFWQIPLDPSCVKLTTFITPLQYFSHTIGHDGIKPDATMVKAITDMPSPTNVAELRQILGMINYLGKFVPDLSTELQPVTALLKKEAIWFCQEVHEQALDKVKCKLATALALAYYDSEKPTIVTWMNFACKQTTSLWSHSLTPMISIVPHYGVSGYKCASCASM
ncbi:hypothetical protein PO909_027773 [Leuciscus waleckii]